MKLIRIIGEVIILLLLTIILFAGIHLNHEFSPPLKNYFVLKGVEETGAINLVSSIYLSYRAFDTMGETIVLLLSVSGIIMLLESKK